MNMKITQFAKRDEFSVQIVPPKAATFDFLGYILFNDPETGLAAINHLHGSQFDGQKLSAFAELRTSLHVQKDIFTAVKNQLEMSIQQLKEDNKTAMINIKGVEKWSLLSSI